MFLQGYVHGVDGVKKMLLLNDKPVSFFKFPGGEIQVKLPEKIEPFRVILTWKPKSSDDIMKLLLTANALHNAGIHDIDLDILYLPYARQDRVCSPGESQSVQVIWELITTANFSTVRVYDPHSRVHLPQIYPTVITITPADIFLKYKILDDFDLSNLMLCAPDKGAIKRVSNILENEPFLTSITCKKRRDAESGRIIEYVVPDTDDDRSILVIDDICDGGSTFVHLANKLRQKVGYKGQNLYLYVTHGIFSNGMEQLYKHYKHIYCHHVLDDAKYQSTDRFTILKEFPHEA